VSLALGENKVCTITNTYTPPRTPDGVSLTIVKNTIGGDGTFSFVTGGAGLPNFDLTTEGLTKSRSFTLDAGTYTVEEDLDDLGVWGFTGLECKGGVSSVAGAKATITLAEGNSATCTFTNSKAVVKGTAQLGDTVWLDANNNGVQDNGEVGYNGADVILKDGDGNVVGTLTTATGAWVGFYSFVGLDAGTYTAMLDLSTIGSYGVTTANSFTVTLAEGDDYLDADFGLYQAPPTTTVPPTTVPPEETLPVTGAETEGIALLGLGLLMLGALAILATRKRRTND
jgi:LPXTG-motif cell wall-anchored protein